MELIYGNLCLVFYRLVLLAEFLWFGCTANNAGTDRLSELILVTESVCSRGRLVMLFLFGILALSCMVCELDGFKKSSK